MQYWGPGDDDGVAKGIELNTKFKNYFQGGFQNK
jgi:hypothetical protein